MECASCRTSLPEDALFCLRCGAKAPEHPKPGPEDPVSGRFAQGARSAVRDRASSRQGRHGRRLSRHRGRARTRARDQGPSSRPRRYSGQSRPVPSRGPHRRQTLPPQHCPLLHLRRRGRHVVFVIGYLQRGVGARLDGLKALHSRKLELLRALWLQAVELRSGGSDAGQAGHTAERLRNLCAEIAHHTNGSSATRPFADEAAEAVSDSPTIERT